MRRLVLSAAMTLMLMTASPAAIGARGCPGGCVPRSGVELAALQRPAAAPAAAVRTLRHSTAMDAQWSVLHDVHRNHAAPSRVNAAVTMAATIGWNGRYRALGAWVPLHVTIHNGGDSVVNGSLNVATPSVTDPLQNRTSRDATYQAGVEVVANAARSVTLYLPGQALPDRLTVDFVVGHSAIASDTLFPVPLDDRDLVVGVLTGDVSAAAWAGRVKAPGTVTDVIRLAPGDLEPTPEALAAFDAIVVTNVNSSLLDAAQLSALERYVRGGGSLIAVGGPDWQETLRPLPQALIPGRLVGTATIHGLPGLDFFGQGSAPASAVTVSTLSRPAGSAFTTPAGVPLIVRSALGVGRIEYLAFDPALDPVQHWVHASGFLTRLITGITPQAMRRLSLPSGFDVLSFRDPGPARTDASSASLSVAGLTLPAIPVGLPIFFALTILYILIVGPAGYLGLRRLRRQTAGWLAAPVLALGLSGMVLAAAPHHRSAGAVLGSVGTVEMGGAGSDYPADVYVRVLSRRPGDHVLTTVSRALPSAVPSDAVPASLQIGVTPTRWVLREGANARIRLPSMSSLQSRVVELRTTYHSTGHIVARLRLDAGGDIVGTVHNGTALRMLHPAVVAGQEFERLPDMNPGSTVWVRVRPEVNVLDNRYRQILYNVYGGLRDPDGHRLVAALSMLPETNVVSMLSEVFLVGWSQQPLIPFTLDGAAPPRQDLTLIVRPLTVGFPAGTFQLRSGTLGAYPLDIEPVTPRYACCPPTVQGIFLGAGGSAVFAFDLPGASRVRARSLSLAAFAGGADTTYTGYSDMSSHATSVYDWRGGRWIDLTFSRGVAALPHPNTLLSPSGSVLVRVRASVQSGDLAIFDPHHDLQLSGRLTMG